MENEFLSKITAAYADIWGDVLLNKNLLKHLETMDEDLASLNELIDGKETLKQNTLPFYRLANQLFRMRDVVRKKVQQS